MLDSESNEFTPDWFSKPADSILGLMRRRSVSVEAVAEQLEGGIETLGELIGGTRVIDESLARSLAIAVGASATFWLKRQANYDRALEHAVERASSEMVDWLQRVPAPGSKPRGRLSEAKKVAELRRRLVFYGVASLRAWE